ncbi:hypothetical protein [Streptomyces scabiei]|uniref:hypothetical protein n=1 Tax=Streptomyces scabiei TaxID=1930 RepID=UPI0029AB33AE|nr:hypothetical protein [Streptomyces scabiei]MDX3517852.1 hypothetical protein [Streptomyces scabiei]
MESEASRDSTATAGARHEEPSGVEKRIAQSAPEVSVVARLAHLQDTAGNAAVVRLFGQGDAAGEDATGAPDPAS